MLDTAFRLEMSENVGKIFGEELQFCNGFWQLKKSRKVKIQKSSDLFISWSLDFSIAFQLSVDNQKALNQAEVFLLPEELQLFIRRMIEHSISFPSNYSQQLTMDRGMYCVRITSYEPPIQFAERLSDSLLTLE